MAELAVDPKVDVAFKRLFGTEDTAGLLIDLLTSVTTPAKPITGLQFVLAQSAKLRAEDKETVGDVKVRDQGGRQFQVEMQFATEWFLTKRLLFYWGQFHSQQLRPGEHYMTLRPTISICFLNGILFPDVAEHHLVFQMREATHGFRLSDDMEFHLIELPKFTKIVEQLTTQLDRWCYFLRHGESLDLATLPIQMDVPPIRHAMEVLTVWTQEEREREIYELRLKTQRDQATLIYCAEQKIREATEAVELARSQAMEKGLEEGMEKGLEEGMEKGMEEGMMKGELIGQITLYQRLAKQPVTPKAALMTLSVEQLAAQLEQVGKLLSTNGH